MSEKTEALAKQASRWGYQKFRTTESREQHRASMANPHASSPGTQRHSKHEAYKSDQCAMALSNRPRECATALYV